MIWWLAALAGGSAVAFVAYGRPRTLSLRVTFALRALSTGLVVALLANAPLAGPRPAPPWIVLDASASWLATGGVDAWRVARDAVDSALKAGGDSLLLVGDSLRGGLPGLLPTDRASRAGALVDVARALGRPVVLITDGRLDDAERLAELPRGSRLLVIAGSVGQDAGIVALEAPRAALAGDTLTPRVLVRAGGAGASATRLAVHLGGARVAELPIPALAAYAEHEVRPSFVVPRREGTTELRVTLAPGDAVAPNDTAHAWVEVSGAAAAVLVSTSPDQDARFALAVLRGTRRGAIRGYWRVAPGRWISADDQRQVDEAAVRRAVATAALVVLHGDTAYFGPPRARARGALVLLAGPAEGDEFYATAAGDSPLRAALAELPWDSLPPLRVSDVAIPGAMQALLTHRARRVKERAALLLSDGARRVVVVSASGMWRWRTRGGRAADAFDALWGSLYDWVGAVRTSETAEDSGPTIAAEWMPRPSALSSGAVGTAAAIDRTPRARDLWWLFVLAALALCAEWVLRRRIGWR